WEYACRAGTTTPFHFGETITADLANYGSYREKNTDVGSFPPNAFGLYDMHGNVWELCADPWHENYHGAPLDGSVWESGGKNYFRLLRGGSWYADPSECRSAYRSNFDTCFGEYDFGFRVVCSSPWTP
ncbi:MAG TPA: serine/threonine protein kinase, partial [Cyanobacteria bacterium UBA11369]|nr:serine/threonine protein kinase [Cyanobacteria bacterium UBA11369]